MKKTFHIILRKNLAACVFLMIIFINGILFFLVPKYAIDTIENKDKLKFPSFDTMTVSGFMKQYEPYFVNHFPYKYAYIKTFNYLKKTKLKSFTSNDEVIIGKNNWLFYNASIYDSLGLNEYAGYKPWPNIQLDKIVSNIIAISTFCKNHDIQFELVICPSKQSIYPEFLPTIYQKKLNNRFDQLMQSLPNTINLKEVFSEYKAHHNQLLYYKTDTHWNLLAGAIAGQEISNKLSSNFEYINSLKNISIKDSAVTNGFDLANMMALKQFYRDTFYKVSFIDKPKQKIPYLIIVSDSFLEALYPSLEQLFQKIETRHLYSDGIPSAKKLLEEKPNVFMIELTERYKELLTGNIDTKYFESTEK